ncbi:MAG: hypothetical protein KY468_10730 [Armatimonadetes bacterium]|nr:hypothetical protein [Armatimonadota bacterium]
MFEHRQNTGPKQWSRMAAGLLLFAGVLSHPASAQDTQPILTTVAGNGGAGNGGDGGKATDASTGLPIGLKIDRYGNLYISNIESHRIRRVSPSGIISALQVTPAGFSFNQPYDIDIDAEGNLYVADSLHHRIVKIDPTGAATIIAGISNSAGLSGDGGPATSAQLNGPVALALGPNGVIYISDYRNNRIRKLTPSGNGYTISAVAGAGPGNPPNGGYFGDGGPATQAHLNGPHGLAVDRAGNLIFVDHFNNRIRMITPEGNITTLAGTGSTTSSGDGGPASSAGIHGPSDVVLDAAGNLYIAEYAAHKIRKVARNGTISTVTGTGEAGSAVSGAAASGAKIHSPHHVEIDEQGNLYFTDYGNNLVRKVSNAVVVTPGLRISKIGGFDVPVYTVGSATAADISLPVGTDPSSVPVEVTGAGISDGVSVQLLKNGADAGSAPLSAGKATFTTALSLNSITVLQAKATVTLTASARQALPKVKGHELVKMELTASLGGPSAIRYLSKEGKGYTLAELQALATPARRS